MSRKNCCDDPECRLLGRYFPEQLPEGYENDWINFVDSFVDDKIFNDYLISPRMKDQRGIKTIIKNTLNKNWQVYGPFMLIEKIGDDNLAMKAKGGTVTALGLALEINYLALEEGKKFFSRADLRSLVVGGLLRDVGMSSINPSIIKSSTYNADDWERVVRHPFCGQNIIKNHFLKEFPNLEKVLAIIGGHHSPRYGVEPNPEYKDLVEVIKIGDVAFGMYYNGITSGEQYTPREVIEQMFVEHNDTSTDHHYDEFKLRVLDDLIK